MKILHASAKDYPFIKEFQSQVRYLNLVQTPKLERIDRCVYLLLVLVKSFITRKGLTSRPRELVPILFEMLEKNIVVKDSSTYRIVKERLQNSLDILSSYDTLDSVGRKEVVIELRKRGIITDE